MVSAAKKLTYDEALAFLFGRINYERTSQMPYRSRGLKLDRMRELALKLGNPHLDYPIIHVAGTKGKGSTSCMIAAILSAAGLKTGLYTSPHLERMEERLRIDSESCSSDQFVDVLEAVKEPVESMDRQCVAPDGTAAAPTYFEILTAMAMLHFSRQQVDAVVLEVGLGGRLDSTNICQPAVSVITSISYDHTRELGNTLEAIAKEKAGIIKPDVPVVCGVTEPRPRSVIREIAGQRSAPLLMFGEDFDWEYQFPTDNGNASTAPQPCGGRLQYRANGVAQGPFPLGLAGRHQAANAALALTAVDQFRPAGFAVSPQAKEDGLANVRCAGRAEIFAGTPPVILDVAHNVASVAALLEVIDEHFPDTSQRTLVLAATRGKDVTGMLRLLLAKFDRVLVTRYANNPRTMEPDELANCAKEMIAAEKLRARDVQLYQRPEQAWQAAVEVIASTDLVCVTGSFFLAAELRAEILNSQGRFS